MCILIILAIIMCFNCVLFCLKDLYSVYTKRSFSVFVLEIGQEASSGLLFHSSNILAAITS